MDPKCPSWVLKGTLETHGGDFRLDETVGNREAQVPKNSSLDAETVVQES